MRADTSRSDESGFTLIEVMMASLVLLVGMVGVALLVNGANLATVSTKSREAGTNLAREIVESGRSIPYEQLAPASIQSRLQALPGLADSDAGAGWTIRRRGTTYTVTATVCSVDDPKDNTGTHDAGSFCDGTSGGGSADRNPDDYKRLTTTVAWALPNGKQRSVTQTSVISNPGLSAGPAIKTLTMTSPGSSPITVNESSASFAITTSQTPAAVNWLVDGATQGAATGSGTSWSFTWPLTGLVDGSYLISAGAFNSFGVSGAKRALTIVLNRFVPDAPTGFAAGRNGSVVELEWFPNPERDIVGYRAYRVVSGGPDVQVCPATAGDVTTRTACQDTSPPSADSVDYYVVAVDRDTSGNFREGTHSTVRTVTRTNNPPNPPTGLAGSWSYGAAIIAWNAPSPADPDSGDSIDFYRIYRDGNLYADRYDRTGSGTELTYTDTATGGSSHTYYVTAVDTQLAESTIVGPVTVGP